MRIDVRSAADEDLKARAGELLAYGALPLEQWANVFANPRHLDLPGLRAKSFSIWFTTMIEYLQGGDESRAIRKETDRRKIATFELFDLYDQLAEKFKAVLCLYSNDEQIFLRDRRLQNVHGRLQLNTYEEHDIAVFDSGRNGIAHIKLTAVEYRSLMTSFYSRVEEISAELVQRCVDSDEFGSLASLHKSKLLMGEHFNPLLVRLGVDAQSGG